MPRITSDQGSVRISEKPGTWVGAFLLTIGILLTFAGSIGLVSVEVRIDTPLLVASGATLIGLICILGFASRRQMVFDWDVIIDAGGFQFQQEARSIRYDTKHFSSIEIQHTGDTNRRRRMYALYLRGADGSYFWLNTEYHADRLQPWIDALVRFLPVPVRNATSEALSLKGIESSAGGSSLAAASSEESPVHFDASMLHAKTRTSDGWEELSLPTGPSWIGRTILMTTALFFLGLPAAIGWQTLRDASGSDGFGIFAYISVMLFLVIFMTAAVGMFILSMRRHILFLRSDQVRLQVRLGWDFLARLLPSFFRRELSIPRDEIRSVRVDRLVGGNLRLALVQMERPGRGPSLADKFFFQLSLFRTPSQAADKPDNIMSLWEIPGTNRGKDGPVMEDLLFMEKRIQERLRLSE